MIESVAKMLERFVARAHRRYEQELRAARAAARLGVYVRQWVKWVLAGVGDVQGVGRVIAAVDTEKVPDTFSSPQF